MEHEHGTSEDPRPTSAGDTSIPPAVAVADVIPTQGKAGQPGDAYAARQLRLNRWLVALTGGLVLVGAFGFGVAVWQSRIASRAADAARIAAAAAEQSAAAARTSAAAAQAQAAASRDQAAAMAKSNSLTEQGRKDAIIEVQDEQRARLSFGVSLQRDVSSEEPNLVLDLHLQTGGNTEARQVRAAVTASRGTAGATQLPPDEWWENADWLNIGVVAATEDDRVVTTDVAMSADDAANYLAGSATIAVLSRIEYCDVFGRRFHTTRCAERRRDLLPRRVDYCGTNSGRVPDADSMCRPQ